MLLDEFVWMFLSFIFNLPVHKVFFLLDFLLICNFLARKLFYKWLIIQMGPEYNAAKWQMEINMFHSICIGNDGSHRSASIFCWQLKKKTNSVAN